MKAAGLITLALLLAGIAAGLQLDRSWLFLAFIGLMLFKHAFGHGSHGGGSANSRADSHHDHDHDSHQARVG